MKYFLVVGFLLFVGSFSPLHAQTPPSEEAAQKVVKLSSEAAIAYDKGNYEQALSLYSQAHQLWANPKISFALVKCLEALQRYKDALQAAERGLRENPPAVLKARFESKIAFLKTTLSKGQLSLLITPSGAAVSVDGKFVGNAPIRALSLEAGEHKLEITHPNHAKIVQGITITGGGELRMNLTLQPVTGRLSIASTPSGAEVEIDGRPWGKTPLSDLAIPVGSHAVAIKYPGYQAVTRQVKISPEQSENVSVVLSEGAAPSDQGERPWFKSVPAWVLLGLALGAAGAGAGLLGVSSGTHQSVLALSKSPDAATSQKDLQDRWDGANTQQKIGYGLLAGGGGLLVVAVILFATRAGVAPEKKASVSLFLPLPNLPPLGSTSSSSVLFSTSP